MPRLALATAWCFACAAAAPDDRPNILFLQPDQWRADWTPPALVSLRMPHFAALQAAGARFTRAVSPAPLCAPSRACMASGREYDAAGVPDNFGRNYPAAAEPTFMALLRAAGYHTMVSGKDDLSKASGTGLDGLFHAAALGWSASRRVEGKQDAAGGSAPHDPYGAALANASLWAAFRGDVMAAASSSSFFPPHPQQKTQPSPLIS